MKNGKKTGGCGVVSNGSTIGGAKRAAKALFVGGALFGGALLFAQTTEAAPPSDPSIACGSIEPGASVRCNGNGEKTDFGSQNLVSSVTLTGGVKDSCNFQGKGGPEPAAQYSARCDQVKTGTTATTTIEIKGHVQRKCGVGKDGSDGQVRPKWAADIVLPDSTKTYGLKADIDANVSGSTCTLSIGSQSFALTDGKNTVLPFDQKGGVTLKAIVDCSGTKGASGLAIAGCYGYSPGVPVSPETLDRSVKVTLTAITK